MSIANIAQSDQLNNHEIQKLVDKTVEVLKLSIVQGLNSIINPQVYKFTPTEITVGGRVKQKYPSAAFVVSERIKKLGTDKIKTVRLALGRNTTITSAIRTKGINIRSANSIIEEMELKKQFAFINDTNFSENSMKRMIADLSISSMIESTPIREVVSSDLRTIDMKYGKLLPSGWLEELLGRLGSSGGTAVLNKSVKFRIHEVKCIDETNPEWPGSDEISWGGAAVDDKGTVTKINEKFVGGGFNDGVRKTYTPPEIIKSFPLDNAYPKEFLVTLALAEKDSGGMADFIQKLYEAIKAEVVLILTALCAAAGAAIGASIGGSVGTAVGGPLGVIIGVVAGAILGALVGWLVSILHDDIFAPQASSLFLYSESDTFPGGGLISSPMTLHFRDHGGHYRIIYDWEIIR